MANLITLSRILLLFVLIGIAYQTGSYLQFLNLPILIVIFITDGLDGFVARKRGESSLFGALFDIAVDRIVENVLWVVLADLNLVPIWVPIVFIIRGSVVDSVRAHAASQGLTPFGMMRSALGRFLVAGRFMRIAYAVIKATAFGWIVLFQPVQSVFPAFWNTWEPTLQGVTNGLVYAAVAFNLARGLPVVYEFVLREAQAGAGNHTGA